MEKGKIKNTITRSFELQDYKIEGTELSGFWADLLSKEELVIDVNYSSENKKTFSQRETETLIQKICNKCESFESQLPKNIRCEVTFKNLGEKVYRTDQPDFEFTSRDLEEIKVSYRFYIGYHI